MADNTWDEKCSRFFLSKGMGIFLLIVLLLSTFGKLFLLYQVKHEILCPECVTKYKCEKCGKMVVKVEDANKYEEWVD